MEASVWREDGVGLRAATGRAHLSASWTLPWAAGSHERCLSRSIHTPQAGKATLSHNTQNPRPELEEELGEVTRCSDEGWQVGRRAGCGDPEDALEGGVRAAGPAGFRQAAALSGLRSHPPCQGLTRASLGSLSSHSAVRAGDDWSLPGADSNFHLCLKF